MQPFPEFKARTDAAPAAPLDPRWTLARHALLGTGLVLAVLQYYLMNVYVEIVSMQGVQFFNPAGAVQRSALEVLRRFC